MLPSFIQSSYKTYKGDTDIIAKWLAVTAKQCGYPADLFAPTDPPATVHQPLQHSQRLKGAARKAAKAAAKENVTPSKDSISLTLAPIYTVKVKDFATLAEYITQFNKPAVQVPVTVVKALNRAIELRSQNNFWSEPQAEFPASSNAEMTNEYHAYFLGILERTQEILKPRMPSDMVHDFLSKSSPSRTGPEQSKDQVNRQIGDMFDNLDIQELSQSLLDAPDIERTTDGVAVQESNYEAEKVQSLEEQYMAAHCLFQDLRSIRSFLRQAWASYKEGVLRLVSVSITTNTAIDFVRSMEQDILKHFPETSDYDSIMYIFYGAQCLNRGHDPCSKQRPGDEINYEVYGLAEEVMLPTFCVLKGLQNAVSPGMVQIYKPGSFGFRDRRTSWNEKSSREKVRDDRLVLMEACCDLKLMGTMFSEGALSEDELMRGVRQMAPGKPMPLWLVFAAQCFLDIQHVLGQDVTRGHVELQQTGRAVRASFEQNLKFHESLRIDTWPRQNDAQFKENMINIDEWVIEDRVAKYLETIKAAAKLPPPEPFRLLKQHPLLCGLFSFAIQRSAQHVGIAFANAWGSILYAANFYNACRQEKLVSKIWKDMELQIALQSSEKFFVGDAPKDADGYLKRFLLSMGHSAAVFSSNRRRNTPVTSKRGQGGLSELCAAGALFDGRYCRNDHSVNWTRESISPIIRAKMENDGEEEASEQRPTMVKTAASGSPIRRSKARVASIATNDFLEDLANALQVETLELTVDYFRMHQFCWILLRRINDDCRPQLLEMYGRGYLEKENQLPFVVGHIFMAATTTNGIANLLLPRRAGVEVSSRLLARAAGPLNVFIENGAAEMESELLAQRLGITEIGFGDLDYLDALHQM